MHTERNHGQAGRCGNRCVDVSTCRVHSLEGLHARGRQGIARLRRPLWRARTSVATEQPAGLTAQEMVHAHVVFLHARKPKAAVSAESGELRWNPVQESPCATIYSTAGQHCTARGRSGADEQSTVCELDCRARILLLRPHPHRARPTGASLVAPEEFRLLSAKHLDATVQIFVYTVLVYIYILYRGVSYLGLKFPPSHSMFGH